MKILSTGLNYWINMDDFEQREKKKMVILFLISMICTILIKKNYMQNPTKKYRGRAR